MTHPANQPSDIAPQAKADQDLAVIFAKVLRGIAKAGPSYDGIEFTNGIPPDSTFGKWWVHLHNLLKSPQLVEWAEQNHIDLSKPISISLRDHIVFTTSSGRREMFTAADEDPLWPVVLAPILSAAKVVAAGNGPLLLTSSNPSSAPDEVVGNFYGEWPPGNASRAAELEQTQTFNKNAANAVSSNVESGPAGTYKLDLARTALGDLEDIHSLSEKLKGIARSGSSQIEEALKNTTLDINPHSTFGQRRDAGHSAPVTLEQLILANNWFLPKTIDELENLIRVINSPALPVPSLGSLGGAMSWPAPLENYDQKTIYSHFYYNLTLPALANDRTLRVDPRGALGYLTKNLHFSQSELRNPLRVIEKIVSPPKAVELEAALQQKMGDDWKTSSSHDWVLSAIATTLDPESMYHPKPNHVAGFNLADGRFNGQPLKTIKQALTTHLIKLNRASAEMAPIAAHLLLSRAAPELLVKDIPSGVTFGSAAWASLKAAVARIEAYSPGSTMQMTFAQVAARDSQDPISLSGHAIQEATSQPAIIEWGKVNGVLVPRDDENYPEIQIQRVKRALSEKTTTLQKTVEQLSTKVPTQRDVALEQLKQKFGVELPYEVKCFRDNSPHGRGPGNLASPTQPMYSLLDFYLSKPDIDQYSNWVSDNRQMPVSLIARLSELPDAKAKHEHAFAAYKTGVEDALLNLVKGQISALPLEDRQNLEFGKIRVFTEGEVTKSETSTPMGTLRDESRVPSQPKNQRALIFQTERDANLEFYEISTQQGQIKKRDDLKKNFKEGLQKEWVETPNHIGRKWKSTAIYEKEYSVHNADKQQLSPLPVTTPDSFNSPRSAYISELVANHGKAGYDFHELFELSKSVTTFDEVAAKEAQIFNIALGFIPGASSIRHLINGDVWAALGDLCFDGVMYLTGSAFGKGAGAAGGARGTRAASAASRQMGRGVLGKAPLTPGSSGRLATRVKTTNVRQLSQRSMDHAQLSDFAKRPDIAEGTYRAYAAPEPAKVTAIVDKKTGNWSQYDVIKNKAYGKKLDNFSPDVPHTLLKDGSRQTTTALTNTEKSLALDNVIQMKGTMKDLQLVANEMHIFVDTYKGVDRLNIVAHGAQHGPSISFLDRGSSIIIDNAVFSPKALVFLLQSKGINPATFNNVRLLVCHSGEGGSRSFGRLLQQEINRPVKAFEGTVSMQHGSTAITEARNDLIKQINQINPNLTAKKTEELANLRMQMDFIGVIEQKVVKDHGSTIKINVAELGEPARYIDDVISYRPIHFNR
ncbi:hypothetical protein GNF76_10045 [Pseudomonas sp. CCM 7893]|uniref:Peptidase C80 domain-containing protein n=1 Tax=Pseudomonas spelaei TaxID=1055469 RepID=A0A6I3W557_9PSED|nr:hypothetical protein [Pseudomonas spelaei]MUF04678.1 hypothetical protein [Pseudomonas spelaei]